MEEAKGKLTTLMAGAGQYTLRDGLFNGMATCVTACDEESPRMPLKGGRVSASFGERPYDSLIDCPYD